MWGTFGGSVCVLRGTWARTAASGTKANRRRTHPIFSWTKLSTSCRSETDQSSSPGLRIFPIPCLLFALRWRCHLSTRRSSRYVVDISPRSWRPYAGMWCRQAGTHMFVSAPDIFRGMRLYTVSLNEKSISSSHSQKTLDRSNPAVSVSFLRWDSFAFWTRFQNDLRIHFIFLVLSWAFPEISQSASGS